ncbi:hypothetical protein BAUCODRAFT_129903 [Baudoinia panamericana UAMH 10762]|uniref:Uncharacterized protein n=1 Tax=Baudoinia panamericana (strain UAMH 10762) TaxID=717646 RepID=M2N2K9_BAUPA|nr:uncharacterized protein BAUCODRAFT_129903 [Baudoinia panamericana UAMH 10762]EMC98168.1 hypothetical protein BAUCODRAFT_129903 [Baudoinia panamericana UAMH 10762]
MHFININTDVLTRMSRFIPVGRSFFVRHLFALMPLLSVLLTGRVNLSAGCYAVECPDLDGGISAPSRKFSVFHYYADCEVLRSIFEHGRADQLRQKRLHHSVPRRIRRHVRPNARQRCRS